MFIKFLQIADDLTVQVKNGQVKGRIQTMLDGSTYYAWQGIPYAAPPVGNLRFQVKFKTITHCKVFYRTSEKCGFFKC